MTISYNLGIPAASHNPSTDQPDMLTNTNAVNTILAVDHVSFNTANGGQHLQSTFPGFASPSAPPVTAASVAYPAAGVADSSRAQLYFQNSQKTFLLSSIRAFALCSGSGGITGGQSLNVTSVVRNSIGNYTITLNANAVVGTNYLVFVQKVNATLNIIPQPSISSSTVINLTTNGVDTDFSIMVIQI